MGGHTGTHSKGAVLLAHAHIDGPLKAYLPTLERMADRADDIDEQILEHPDELALAALHVPEEVEPATEQGTGSTEGGAGPAGDPLGG